MRLDLGLHGRVQVSDIVVLARVVDPAPAVVSVERVLKGKAPTQITLVAYVDGFAVAAQRKPPIANARELLFLRKKDDAYAPVQDQYGRLAVNGDRLVDSFRSLRKNRGFETMSRAGSGREGVRSDQSIARWPPRLRQGESCCCSCP